MVETVALTYRRMEENGEVVPSTPSSIGAYLRDLHAKSSQIINIAVEDNAGELGSLLQLDLDIQAWEETLKGRPETDQLTAARRELAFAVYACSEGLYIHAYAGLRIFLELTFAAVYFSANELHRRRWIADRADFSWREALDEDNGILAANFVREFSETASRDSKQFAAIAATCYRRCSQFIHGKSAVTKSLPNTLAFSPEVLRDWIQTATEAARAVLFLLYARYGDELLPEDESGKLASTLESSFSHLVEIRRRLGLPIEN